MSAPAAPIVVGGGVAGSAAAIALARAGARPLLLEARRETGDAICGGFLSWRSLAALDRLGLGADALGGQVVRRVRLFAGGASAEAALPRPGLGLSRRALDGALIAAAAQAGAAVERGVAVRAIHAGRVETEDGATLASPAIFVAHGKHGMHGRERVPPAATRADPVVGLRVRLAASPALARMVDDAVELFLFDRGYAGLVRHEDGSANLCLAVRKSRLAEAGGRPEALIAAWGAADPRLGERLAAAPAIGAPDAIARIPYGWRRTVGEAGLWQLGDQAACIPSLAGEGMGIALAGAASAVASWRRGGAADVWQRGFAERLAVPMALARAAWAAAERPWLAPPATALLAHAPWLLRALARATRVPGEAA